MVAIRRGIGAPIDTLEVRPYAIPTSTPREADGTLSWSRTVLVVAEVSAADCIGLGYTYADSATATFIRDQLAPVIRGRDAMAVPGMWAAMRRAIRNLGRPGVASMAMAAVDVALWDLKAKLLGLPLVTLLGALRPAIAVYGSGGFTSYSERQIATQFSEWAGMGVTRFKMKVGTRPADDPRRVEAAREAVGPDAELFVDANGAYTRKQALAMAERFACSQVVWFEEPVSSDDLEGLRLLRDRSPAGMDIAAGEYGYHLFYFRRMLDAGAVDVLQADATRCAGITEFLRVGALCEAYGLPLSAHTAPTLHAHPCCALSAARHVEYFHDHARIEHMLFDGALGPIAGGLVPDLSRPGLGIDLKRADAERFALG